MIPLRDENPSKTVPVVNGVLILANITAFVYQHVYRSTDAQTLFYTLGFIPYEFFHFADIGPKNMVPIPLTIVTAMFMHAGWFHLLSNMLYLWIFGDNIEDRLGHRKYLFFYLFCGAVATLVHGVIHMNSKVPAVGASGAIAGVLGAYMFLFPRARIRVLFIFFIIFRVIRVPAILLLGLWFLIQILEGVNMQAHVGVAWFAHIGGFLTGCFLGLSMKKKR